MARGRLEPPILDDRTWRELVDEARRITPQYAPEHTDLSPSDPLVVMLELFAWLVEGMSYRLNRVTDRNYMSFLNLIGVTRDPASPASLMLTYTMAPGQPPVTIPRGARASTAQVDDNPPVVFETDENVDLLAANMIAALSIGKVIFNKYTNISKKLITAPLSRLRLSIPAGQSVMLTLGFDAPFTDPMTLKVRMRDFIPAGDADVTWHYSVGTTLPSAWPQVPGAIDETNHLNRTGVVNLTVPPAWTAQSPKSVWEDAGGSSIYANSALDSYARALHWVGVRVSNLSAFALEFEIEFILFNSAKATNALTVNSAEFLGESDGSAFQLFALRNRPLYKDLAASSFYDHLTVEVREPVGGGLLGPWESWTRTGELPADDAKAFRLDPVTAEIQLGNFDATTSPDGRGRIPPVGSEIRASTYRYAAGGERGNVAPASVTVPLALFPGVIGVSNPNIGKSGSDEEPIERAKRRGPEVLRNRYRAVTEEDAEYLAIETTTDLAIVRALGPRLWSNYDVLPAGIVAGDPWTFGALNRSSGNMQLIIVPNEDIDEPTPQPAPKLIREVSDYLQTRRITTSLLQVVGPRYLPVNVTLDVRVWQQAVNRGLVEDPTFSLAYENELRDKLQRFLHPVRGRADETGWQVGGDVMISEIFDFVQPDNEIGFIADISIAAATPLYTPVDRPFPVGVPSVWLQLADYELVCSGPAHAITVSIA